MAEALLRARTVDRVPDLRIGSFGRVFEGEPAHRHARTVVAELGGDLDRFRSRRWNRDRLERADLVLTMEVEHVRDLVVLEPGALRRVFTLPEFIRLGTEIGSRRRGEPLDRWIDRVGGRRDHRDYLRPGAVEEIDDPIGGPRRQFRVCAAEIDHHVRTLVDLAWPDCPRGARPSAGLRAAALVPRTGSHRTQRHHEKNETEHPCGSPSAPTTPAMT